jgi:hypothetical protein
LIIDRYIDQTVGAAYLWISQRLRNASDAWTHSRTLSHARGHFLPSQFSMLVQPDRYKRIIYFPVCARSIFLKKFTNFIRKTYQHLLHKFSITQFVLESSFIVYQYHVICLYYSFIGKQRLEIYLFVMEGVRGFPSTFNRRNDTTKHGVKGLLHIKLATLNVHDGIHGELGDQMQVRSHFLFVFWYFTQNKL